MWKILKNSRDLLGMNARNLRFIRPSNPAKAINLADDKLATEEFLSKAELPVAELLAVIRNRKDLYSFDWESLPKSFVIKPNRGLGGGGIMVIYGRKKNGSWVTSGQREVNKGDLSAQVANILDGNFSLANVPDMALIEERLKTASFFKPYSPQGVFDIRVIVYNKVPIMAMLRLPTKKSGGKANLAQGGIGVGIDIATGVTTHAVAKGWWSEKEVEHTPEGKLPLRGIKLPHWLEILNLAVRTQILSGLGYMGIDITIDQDKGPVILEINARPGLSIQNANLASLKDRLQRVSGLKITSTQKGVKVAQELFGGEIEQELEEISGKQVLGLIEKIKLVPKEGEEIELAAKIDTGADTTSIDLELAKTLGYSDCFELFEAYQKTGLNKEEAEEKLKELKVLLKEKGLADLDATIIYSGSGTSLRPVVPLTFTLAGTTLKTKATVAVRQNLTYPMIVGRRDLKKFLVDPAKITEQ